MSGDLGAAEAIVHEAVGRRVTIATAESLTAGMVCSVLGAVSGASGALQGGIVAYQNSVKTAVLGVDAALLDEVGSVDARVALAMSAGACRVLDADFAVATTGVAGPLAHDGKPVGTVFVAVTAPGHSEVAEYHFAGNREQIRQKTTAASLELLLTFLRAQTE